MKRLHSSQYSLDLYTNSSLDDGLSMSEGENVIPYTVSQAVDTIVSKQPEVDFMM